MTGQLQLPAPSLEPTPCDLRPDECRWAWWGYSGPEEHRPDGQLIEVCRPVKQIGWVRGRRYDPGINGICPLP